MANIAFRFLSWNLDNFGKFDYSGTMAQIARTIYDSGADIVVILEVFSQGTQQGSSKRVKIGDVLATADAKVAIEELLAELKLLDNASNWKNTISGVNAGSKERDTYAFYWKSTPQGAAPPGLALPASIDNVTPPPPPPGKPLILRQGPNNKKKPPVVEELKFASSRRPGACKFKMVNGTDTKYVWLCGFHASAQWNARTEDPQIKNSVRDCITAATYISTENKVALPIVIGGDLNLDYTTYKEDFYDTLAFKTALTDGTGTSLLVKPDLSGKKPVVAKNAYDNFLYNSIKLEQTWVINVIEAMATEQYGLDPKKRPLKTHVQEAHTRFYTKDNSTTSSISDHLPIVGAFSF